MPTIVGNQVGPISFGTMGFARPPPIPEEQAFAALKEALAQGSNLWNAGEFYGTPEYNSLTVLNHYFTKYPEDASKVVLQVKGCLGYDYKPRGKAADVRASVENCIKLLGGTKKIDIFEPARVDKSTSIEETVGELSKLVEEGKIGGVALSEAGVQTIRRAAKITKIVAVETELNLFHDAILAPGGVAATCAELGIPILAYSPLGRGLLTGQVKKPEDLTPMQQRMPRFQGENFQKNLELVKKVEELAAKHGVTAPQYAIAWVAVQSLKPGMPEIIPLPGANTAERVKENMAVKKFKLQDFEPIDEFLKTFETQGTRYPEGFMEMLDD